MQEKYIESSPDTSDKLGIILSIESYCSVLLLWIGMSSFSSWFGQTDLLMKQDQSLLPICVIHELLFKLGAF